MAKQWMMVMNDGETYSPVEECTVVCIDIGDGFEGDVVDQRVKDAVKNGHGAAVVPCLHTIGMDTGGILLPEADDGR